MKTISRHLIFPDSNIKSALVKLNELGEDAILFVVDLDYTLIGSITDGDVRRALISGINLETKVFDVCNPSTKFIIKGENDLDKIIFYRNSNYKIIPIVDNKLKIIDLLNFGKQKSYLPIDILIMAGGRGVRLRPMTDLTPKPLLKVGDKSIIEYNIDRLASFGVKNICVSVRYLGKQIIDHLSNVYKKEINFQFLWEDKPLGTIGAAAHIEKFEHEHLMIMNSDLLTNIDFELFFSDFLKEKADLSILTIPYKITIPYAVINSLNKEVLSIVEKPTYTYYSNGGVYLIKSSLMKLIPKDVLYNATDLIDLLLAEKKKVIKYPFSGYWLDIGRPEDFIKAQDDLKTL